MRGCVSSLNETDLTHFGSKATLAVAERRMVIC